MKAVYLNLPAEAYITAILAVGLGPGRSQAVRSRCATGNCRPSWGARCRTGGSVGELAAIAWMVERGNQERAKAAGGRRVLVLDFETMLADMETSLANVLRHFDLPPVADRLVKSPALTRYSKAPEQLAFSPQVRAQLMHRSREMHVAEIEKGLALIHAL